MIQFNIRSLEEITKHGEEIFPDECCGFMYGTESADGLREVTEVQRVNNAKEGDKKRRFEISPKDYLRAEDHAYNTGKQLLGIYHSHPNHPSIASETDRLSAQPYFSYVIVSVQNGTADSIQSWRLNEDFQFEEESISNNHFTNKSISWQQ